MGTALQMKNNQKVHLKVAEKDVAGQPITADGIVWASSNSEVVTIENISADGNECDAVATGALGVADISVADTNDGISGGPLTLTIVGSGPVLVDIQAGEPIDK